MKKLFMALVIISTPFIEANHYTITSVGYYDHVYGPDGYHGTGYKMGDYYHYDDNSTYNNKKNSEVPVLFIGY